MKKIFSLILLLTCAVLAQMQGPKIYFPEDQYNFGLVRQGDTVRHAFIIVNKGDDTLKITNIITSCGCTAATLANKILAPGESVPLSIQFNSHGRVGEQVKYISIMSNDKDKPSAQVILKGSVSADDAQKVVEIKGPKIEFKELQFDFGAVPEGTICTHVFEFKNIGTEILEIKDIKTSCGCTAAVVSEALLSPGETGTLKVDLNTAGRFGRVQRDVTITTNEKDTPLKSIKIFSEIIQKEKK
ncbi:MAG: DUF1573 domain-containing protein [Ignavibacteria bacterium]|nr:DUF1573 domain-containing protein [Ignavibacteria bacterium]